MTEKELRKLNRYQLLELLVMQTERVEKLQKQLEQMEAQFNDQDIRLTAMGSIAEASLRNLKVDKAFIGCNGVDFQNGYTTTNLFEGQIKQAMMKSANQTYMLADSSKFGKNATYCYCPFKRIRAIVTDACPGETFTEAAKLNGIELHYPEKQ